MTVSCVDFYELEAINGTEIILTHKVGFKVNPKFTETGNDAYRTQINYEKMNYFQLLKNT